MIEAEGGVFIGGQADVAFCPAYQSIMTAVWSHLSQAEPITALVESNVWKGLLPQEYSWSTPAITLHHISEEFTHDLDGAGGTAISRVQIDCWGITEDSSEQLAEQVRLLFHGYSGMVGSKDVLEIECDGLVRLHEEPKDASDWWRYHIAVDFLIDYRVDIPQF